VFKNNNNKILRPYQPVKFLNLFYNAVMTVIAAFTLTFKLIFLKENLLGFSYSTPASK
jgi:hypothetical protein